MHAGPEQQLKQAAEQTRLAFSLQTSQSERTFVIGLAPGCPTCSSLRRTGGMLQCYTEFALQTYIFLIF